MKNAVENLVIGYVVNYFLLDATKYQPHKSNQYETKSFLEKYHHSPTIILLEKLSQLIITR